MGGVREGGVDDLRAPSPPQSSIFGVLILSPGFGRALSMGGVSRGMNTVLLSPAAGHLNMNIWLATHVETLAV